MSYGLSRDGGGRGGEPPILANYQNEPRYDAATILERVGVRPMVLHHWENNLGVPAPIRVPDGAGGTMRRYSDRDLVAAIWLRDQVLNSVNPDQAVERLRAAQPNAGRDNGWGAGPDFNDPLLARGRVNTGPLPDNTLAPRRGSVTSGNLRRTGPNTSGELRRPGSMTSGDLPRQGSATGEHAQYGAPPALGRAAPPSQMDRPPADHMQPPVVRAPAVTRRLNLDPNASAWQQLAAGAMGVTSGPLPPPPTVAPSLAGSAAPQFPLRLDPPISGPFAGVPWVGPGAGVVPPREFRPLLPALLKAFSSLDTHAANSVMAEALSSRHLETVCIKLLQPALARITDLSNQNSMSPVERHFALNYVRGVLFAFFQKASERFDAPLVVVGCGQRDLDDTASLMLAVFWRRAGLRVAFLGQDVEGAELVAEVRQRRPALVALTISTSQRIRSLARVAKEIAQIEPQRPIFTFGGPIFVRHAELQRKVSGIYLGDDAGSATWHVCNLLGIERSPMQYT
ncbi:MAG TPA: cobalamin B12-binding domain-containing protein [Ktedonobacterales bacterium]|nr:cobalamin B12-binding domain-containing protein [Ktedonobacterales bacterium]